MCSAEQVVVRTQSETAVCAKFSALSRTQSVHVYREGHPTWKACEGGGEVTNKRKLGGRKLTHSLSLSLTLPLSMSDGVLGDCCSGEEENLAHTAVSD